MVKWYISYVKIIFNTITAHIVGNYTPQIYDYN